MFPLKVSTGLTRLEDLFEVVEDMMSNEHTRVSNGMKNLSKKFVMKNVN